MKGCSLSKKNIRTIELEILKNMTEKIREILLEHGIDNLYNLSMTPKVKLEEIGIEESDAAKLVNEVNRLRNELDISFISQDALIQHHEEREILTTGCKSLDDLLEGGLETTKLYEFYGPEMVGKTKFLHQLICTAALPKNLGGLESPAIYIDAEGSYDPERIEMMTFRFDLELKTVLKGVTHIPVVTTEALVKFVEEQLIRQIDKTHARLILLDTIITLPRSEFIGMSALPARQQNLGKIAEALKEAAEYSNGVAVVSNQTIVDFKNGEISPSGGNVLGPASQYRVAMRFAPEKPEVIEFFTEKGVDLPQASYYLRSFRNGFHDVI